jgi:hypothetical protein
MTYKWVYDFVYWQFVVSDLRQSASIQSHRPTYKLA